MRALTLTLAGIALAMTGCVGGGSSPVAPSCSSVAASADAKPAPSPSVAPLPLPTSADLSWIPGAQRIVLHHTTGGLMGSEGEEFDLRRVDARFYGVAIAGGRDMYGKYVARMWKVDVDAKSIDAILLDLATSEAGTPDTRTMFVEASDTYLAWSLTIDDVEVCESRSCRPQRSIRLAAQPDGHDFYHWYADGHDFYHWYAWAGLAPVALDRRKPDAAASALLARLTNLGNP